MNKIILFILLTLLSFFSFSQKKQSEVNTSLKTLKKFLSSGDTTGLKSALLDFSINYNFGKNQINEDFIKDLKSKVTNVPNSYKASIYSICRMYYSNTPNSNAYFENMYLEYKSLLRVGKRKDLIWLLLDIGNVFFSMEEYGQAKDFYLKTQEIAKEFKDYDALSLTHLNLGLIAKATRRLNESLKEYKLSTYYRLKSKQPGIAFLSHFHTAGIYLDLNKLDDALQSIQSANQAYNTMYLQKELHENTFKSTYYVTLANYYIKKGDIPNMNLYIDSAGKVAELTKNNLEIADIKMFKARLLGELKEYKIAKNELVEALKLISGKSSLVLEMKTYYSLGVICSHLKEYKLSSESFAKSIQLNKEYLKSSEKLQLDFFKTVSAIFNSEKKLEKAEQKIVYAELKNATSKTQRNVSMIFTTILTVTIFIISFLFVKLQKKEKQFTRLNKTLRSSHIELHEKKLQLEKTNQIKDKLFSIIAHDLRNPLNRMSVELTIMKRTLEDKTVTKAIERTLKETINLFERLLQWSKMENKQHIYLPVETNLNETLNKVIAFYYPEIKSRNIEIVNNNKSYTVFVDPNFLQTLFRNILSNSITAVSKNGKIQINLEKLNDENIQILFQDSGNGFSPDIVEYFNNPLAKLTEISSGVGLVLCKELSKISGWKMKIATGGLFNGAIIQLNIPLLAEVDGSSVTNYIEDFNLNLSDDWKVSLSPLKRYKFYQTSEIRSFLKNIEPTSDENVTKWRENIEKAVFDGNESLYSLLMSKID